MTRRAALVVASALALCHSADASPVLHSADARIEFASAASCTVEMTLDVIETTTGAPPASAIEHRIQAVSGTHIALTSVEGARRAGEVSTIGATRGLSLESAAHPYRVRYTVDHPADRPFRCPLWLPTIPTDGRRAAVTLTVRLPPGARAGGTLPGLVWQGDEGSATLGHLPAFVHVPFALPGEPVPWNTSRVMDGVAIAALFAATLWWLSRGLAP